MPFSFENRSFAKTGSEQTREESGQKDLGEALYSVPCGGVSVVVLCCVHVRII
eukprot:COSAG06_NODE_58239_length_277_cov_1.443820_1_plen_52_part_10